MFYELIQYIYIYIYIFSSQNTTQFYYALICTIYFEVRHPRCVSNKSNVILAFYVHSVTEETKWTMDTVGPQLCKLKKNYIYYP